MVTLSMTLTDLNPGFKVTAFFWSRISEKRRILGTKLLYHTNRKPYLTYGMVPCFVTLNDLETRRAVCQR